MSIVREKIVNLKKYMQSKILGQEDLVDKLIITMLADGHALVEGAPGLAKTKAIKTLADCIEASFSRIQFTPDLLPSDITGSDIYVSSTGDFEFRKGPVFANMVLADEINRAPAKVQSALLEAMAERQVSVGGKQYKLPQLFMVMATQNPIEHEGTYNLPEAQLDRFLMYIKIDQPSAQTEREILNLVRQEEKSDPVFFLHLHQVAAVALHEEEFAAGQADFVLLVFEGRDVLLPAEDGFLRLGEFRVVHGVERVAVVLERRADDFAQVVQKRHPALEVGAVELAVVRRDVARGGGVGQAGDGNHVRNGVVHLLVEGEREIALVNVGDVGQKRLIELAEHALLVHQLDHVRTRENHVVAARAVLELRVHRLVRVEVVHLHLAAELPLEFLDNARGHVVGPSVDVEDGLLRPAANESERRGEREGGKDGEGELFHRGPLAGWGGKVRELYGARREMQSLICEKSASAQSSSESPPARTVPSASTASVRRAKTPITACSTTRQPKSIPNSGERKALKSVTPSGAGNFASVKGVSLVTAATATPVSSASAPSAANSRFPVSVSSVGKAARTKGLPAKSALPRSRKAQSGRKKAGRGEPGRGGASKVQARSPRTEIGWGASSLGSMPPF